jgi:hypothetical protein
LGYDNPAAASQLHESPEITAKKVLESTPHHILIIEALRPQIEMLREHGIVGSIEYLDNSELQFVPSIHGLIFFMRCQGVGTSSPEAFLLIQKRHFEEQGLDILKLSKDDVRYTEGSVMVRHTQPPSFRQ